MELPTGNRFANRRKISILLLVSKVRYTYPQHVSHLIVGVTACAMTLRTVRMRSSM